MELGLDGAQRQKSVSKKYLADSRQLDTETPFTVDSVEESGLAHRLLSLRCGVTDVVPGLVAADETFIGIYFVRLK